MNQASGISKTLQLAGWVSGGLAGALAIASVIPGSPLASLGPSGSAGAAVNFLYWLSVPVWILVSLAIASFFVQSTWIEARKTATGAEPPRWPRYTILSVGLLVCLMLGYGLPRIVFGNTVISGLRDLYWEVATVETFGALLLGIVMYALALLLAWGLVRLWVVFVRNRRRQQFQRALDH